MIEEKVYSLNSDGKDMERIVTIMKEIIHSSLGREEDIIFLCIGSDQSLGDSLGPLVGTMLKEQNVPYHVYGTLEKPINAFHIESAIKEIKLRYKKTLIISVGACLGEQNQVGYMFLRKGPLVQGDSLNGIVPIVGDYHFSGVVNYIDPLPTKQFLNDTRLYTIMNLARTIVNIIVQTVEEQLKLG